ncbi:hypothetical protein AMJ71_08075 [candidate division TA06 bacterium SM1_40]|uniref:NADH:ubiquinone oxidoreductase-like 20kDa subunit domain-containing protein n=1 Tax=candidate division TA06 bacterium SM1_40 TaxID=1703773 RepID=A0A0S8JJ20_UNCT6|nr:MAG: hypothetical protein AMJ71_08075 [candidate division TA06 bacterium SM1_40]
MGTGKRIGIFKYSSCAGCQFQLFYFQHYVLETIQAVDIVYCKMLQSGGEEDGPFDLALIEGAITEQWQADQLKRIRERSELLAPIGSCAVCGGVPAIKNTAHELDAQRRVYEDISVVHSLKAHPVDHYVRVDGYVRGCPPGVRDLAELVKSLLLNKTPRFLDYSVCVECKLEGAICVLVAYQEPCMGPVTSAGCGALCPSRGRACYGCWGPMKDANAKALADRFERMGLGREDIYRRFTEFGEPTVEWKPGQVKP